MLVWLWFPRPEESRCEYRSLVSSKLVICYIFFPFIDRQVTYHLFPHFLYQACEKIRLCVAVALNYLEDKMTYLFEPKAPNEGPIMEMMAIELPSGTFFCFRTMIFRERYSQGEWRLVRMQLTTLSPVVSLTVLEFVANEGMFCQGPVDPWNAAENVALFPSHAIYWVPYAVYNRVPLSVHCQTLRAQASVCPYWAFSTSEYTVRFLVHQLILYKFAPLKILIHSSN